MKRTGARGGFTLLEFEVAMIIFGLALCGVLPLAVIYAHMFRLQDVNYPEQSVMWFLDNDKVPESNEWYLVPANYDNQRTIYVDDWARKLGVAAYVSSEPPPDATSVLSSFSTLCDDDDVANYGEVGADWADEPGGFNGSSRSHLAVEEGQENNYYADWTFNNLPVGWYQFQATWTVIEGQTTAAQYEIFDDASSKGSAMVDQSQVPSGVLYHGYNWQILGTYHLQSGAAKVRLYSSSTGSVLADAVRIVPLKVLSLQSLENRAVKVEIRIGDAGP